MTDIGAQVSASLNALTREFDIIAHNIANVSTGGFKRRCNSFTQVLAAQEAAHDGQADGEASQGVFDFSQGPLTQTDRTLDFALHGDGFFVLESPEGPLYTRHGVFHTNRNGQLVDTMGRLVAGVAGPLIVPGEVDVADLYVADDGRVMAGQATIGRFRIVDFPDEYDRLLAAGHNCFMAPEEVEPVEAADVIVRQGFQEASNVRLVDELVNMILVSRMYEANTKLVAARRDASSTIIGVAMG